LNIADRLRQTAAQMPEAVAIACPRNGSPVATLLGEHDQRVDDISRRYATITFRQLDAAADRVARGLVKLGVEPGVRLATLVRPGIEFIAVVFGIFRAGAVTVLIDPGMGRRNLVACLAAARPDGFVAIPVAHAIRSLLRRRFPAARYNVTLGRRWWWGGPTLAQLCQTGARSNVELPHTAADQSAAVIFTTGSTGPPKGVHYLHGNFDAQVDQIRDFYDIQPGEVDLSGFPLFALFNSAMGVTTVIPKMDASRPARVDPANIVQAVVDWQATQAFGSPAIWNRVGRYCQDRSIRLPSLRRVLSAGAPVPADVVERMKQCIAPDGDVHTPYGATEALPVASISGAEILGETRDRTNRGAGVCVGRRFDGIRWKVIRIDDGPIADLSDVVEEPAGTVGELIVRGPVVTREYVTRTDANPLSKIADGPHVWHRMGDLGYFDDDGRFWFCGRKAHRVRAAHGTMYTIPCEAVFNVHPGVYRTALVGVGPADRQTPVIVAEPHAEHWPRDKASRDQLLAELRELAQYHDHTRPIEHFLLRRSLPVDIRHNAKIFRERLAPWAARRIGSAAS
jgi:acyl-CoA synthetase (AMP-forming)/AMP-acid ligase II